MVPIQEIDFYTNSNAKLTCNMIMPESDLISAEVLIYDPNLNVSFSTLHTLGQYNNVKSAFEDIIDYCARYSTATNTSINRINNPFNTQFIDQTTQQMVIDQKGPGINVEVSKR